ncbi:TPA: hypothetical protein ACSAFW_004413, partial [Yersinia enterocolitica]
KNALLDVPAGFRGEYQVSGARKIAYVKYYLFGCIFPQLYPVLSLSGYSIGRDTLQSFQSLTVIRP